MAIRSLGGATASAMKQDRLEKNDEFSFVFTEFKGSEGHSVGIQIPRK